MPPGRRRARERRNLLQHGRCAFRPCQLAQDRLHRALSTGDCRALCAKSAWRPGCHREDLQRGDRASRSGMELPLAVHASLAQGGALDTPLLRQHSWPPVVHRLAPSKACGIPGVRRRNRASRQGDDFEGSSPRVQDRGSAIRPSARIRLQAGLPRAPQAPHPPCLRRIGRLVGAEGFEPPTTSSQSWRTTRLCNAPQKQAYYIIDSRVLAISPGQR